MGLFVERQVVGLKKYIIQNLSWITSFSLNEAGPA